MDEMTRRLDYLVERLRSAYDGIGHSSGRPYVYFVYPPEQERAIRRLVDENLRSDDSLCYHHIDLLPLTIESVSGQEERREELLEDPVRGSGAATSILRLWARTISRTIGERLANSNSTHGCAARARPVVVLLGLAALHPLGNPTSLMEALAEQEPREPQSGRIVPIVLLVPGIRPPHSSRSYLFMGLETQRLDFYRGEEA